MKFCSRCNIEKPASEFNKSSKERDGLQYRCRECQMELYSKIYSEKRQEYLERSCDYRQKNKERVSEYNRRYYKINKEALSEYDKKYRKENREKIAARRKKYTSKNKSKIALQRKGYYEKNVKAFSDRNREWRKNNPERLAAISRKRRATVFMAEGTHTANDVRNLITLQKGMCAYCKKMVRNNYHVDHIVALAKGGANSPDNLQILCPSCNLSKSDKCPIEFAQSMGMLL